MSGEDLAGEGGLRGFGGASPGELVKGGSDRGKYVGVKGLYNFVDRVGKLRVGVLKIGSVFDLTSEPVTVLSDMVLKVPNGSMLMGYLKPGCCITGVNLFR